MRLFSLKPVAVVTDNLRNRSNPNARILPDKH